MAKILGALNTGRPNHYGPDAGDGFLVYMTRDEVARLIGFWYGDRNMPPLKEGTELHISTMYRQLEKLKEKRIEVDRFLQLLKEIGELIELRNPLKLIEEEDVFEMPVKS